MSGDGRTTEEIVSAVLSVFIWLFICYLTFNTFEGHRLHFRNPMEQVLSLRIIFLTAVIGFVSCLIFILPRETYYFVAVFDLYEGYALYCFMFLLVVRAGGESNVRAYLREKKDAACLLCPACGCECVLWKGNATPLPIWRFCVVQFAVLKPVASLALAVVDSINDSEPMYLKLIASVLVIVAVQALMQLHHHLDEEYLQGFRTIQKFLLIKLIVGIFFLQEFILGILVNDDVIDSNDDYTANERGNRILAYLMSLEMVAWSILFRKYYSYDDYASDALLTHNGRQGQKRSSTSNTHRFEVLPGSDGYYIISRKELVSLVFFQPHGYFAPMEPRKLIRDSAGQLLLVFESPGKKSESEENRKYGSVPGQNTESESDDTEAPRSNTIERGE